MPEPIAWSRRRFISAVGAAAALAPLGCGGPPTQTTGGGSARLAARPGSAQHHDHPGDLAPRLGPPTYDGFLLVPESYVAGTPMPLVLALHGASTRASAPLLLRPYAESRGFIVLSVDSVGLTWDAITFKYLSDVQFIDRALAHAFERCTVDPERIVVEGFSDGASYALGSDSRMAISSAGWSHSHRGSSHPSMARRSGSRNSSSVMGSRTGCCRFRPPAGPWWPVCGPTDTWWTTTSSTGDVELKPLVDDATWSTGGNYIVKAGTTVDIYPFFGASVGRLVQVNNFYSPQLRNYRSLIIYLPPSYSENIFKRYPVLYMHDGQNIFQASTAFGGVEWGVDETANRLVQYGLMDETLIVGIYNTGANRIYEYTPCCDPTYGGGGANLYERFVIDTVKPWIDSRYRTLTGGRTPR